ncbi:gfo/Idh/MocA family oxidoreductase, partial [filamentous cyanobacterium CCP1]
SAYQIIGTEGDLSVKPAYTWQGSLTHTLTVDGESKERTFESRDQLAAEFVYFSDCILQDKDPEPSGMEGLNDVRIIRALYDSIETGKPVAIENLEQKERPDSEQSIERPPVEEKPDLVRAAPPPGKS